MEPTAKKGGTFPRGKYYSNFLAEKQFAAYGNKRGGEESWEKSFMPKGKEITLTL